MRVPLSTCGSRSIRPFARIALLWALAFFAPAALAQEEPAFQAGVVVVQFDHGTAIQEGAAKTGLAAFDRAASPFGVVSIERPFAFLDHVEPRPETERNLMALRRTYYVRYSADEDPLRVAKALAVAEGVTYAEPALINRYVGPMALPDDSLFGEQAYLRHLRLPEAWDIVKGEDGNPPAVIAIVDGGGDWRHEDLRANVWTNEDEIPGNGDDDDNNGFIDDVHGANFANEDDTDNDPAGLPETPDGAWHGTATAGAASAVTDNKAGIAGAAWNAELMHVNVSCRHQDVVCHGYEGILYAAANGADIINVSWSGWPQDQELQMIAQTLDLATDMGALVVAAAGNNNWSIDVIPIYPAIHPRVLSVGATARDSRGKASFSNYGKRLNVFAPGEGIVTTAPDGEYSQSVIGTSLAAPLVSGVAALAKTRYPDLSPDALREQVRLASESINAENPGYAGRLGRGFVNAEAAVQAPVHPGVRIHRWASTDADGDGHIAPGEQVTIKATVVNHLADARQLTVGLTAFESYPYIDQSAAEHVIGSLPGGDSAEVTLSFSVASDAPLNSRVRFYARIRAGAFSDEVDQISLGINRNPEALHGALSALYIDTGGEEWSNNRGWDISATPALHELAQWHGVKVRQDWLVGLGLQSNNLSGALPEALGNLSNLLWMNMRFNSLSGAIPSEVGQLVQLQELLLDENDLSGEIPKELGNLPRLRVLALDNNGLSGTVPGELGQLSQLNRLYLHKNALSGVVPGQLGNLAQLQQLYLSGNELSGAIPGELGSLSQLKVLSLHENSLSGSIPKELGNLEQVRSLWLSKNALSGSIPGELGNLPNLHWLSLWENNLSGPIPGELGKLSQLRWLRLYRNSLSGEIPREIANLLLLVELSLYHNDLSGPIPKELGSLARLVTLNLKWNHLSGAIPAELGNLTRLKKLNLEYNALSGSIPAELGSLSQLQKLELRGNELSGTIPATLWDLTQLQILDLNSNALEGEIPEEVGNLSQLRLLTMQSNSFSGSTPKGVGKLSQLVWLLLGNNDLSGPIPRELAGLSQLKWMALDRNSLSGQIPSELGNLTNLTSLHLSDNALSGAVPRDFGNLENLERLDLSNNNLTGVLPRSFLQLVNLESLLFGGQELCAPQDEAFQTWLGSIARVRGPTCTGVYFAEDIPDVSFTRDEAIAPLVFPPAAGGSEPYAYSLAPALPAGLVFDDSTRAISGTPTELMDKTAYTFAATDADGLADSLTFSMEVISPVHAIGTEDIPSEFAVYGNYPNPFREATSLAFDLPWPARVAVEVLDLAGRRVLMLPEKALAAGRSRTIEVSGDALSSGLYLYRLVAASPEGTSVHAGRFIGVR